eukprot:TRINITY_DN2018_c0_g1_i1.p1 TRINITY_DN2018_c0_g1~~TRINITY_DN2018_c0_g1_i1.p1  ORF type:complete len:829 (+),score=180.08 TRINITY_DN2018_c0_g1_i1:70-2487(+)
MFFWRKKVQPDQQQVDVEQKTGEEETTKIEQNEEIKEGDDNDGTRSDVGFVDVQLQVQLKTKEPELPEHLRNSSSIRVIHTGKSFIVKERDVFDPAEGRVVNTFVFVVIKSTELAGSLSSVDIQFTIDPEHVQETNFLGVPKPAPVVITAESLFANIQQLQGALYGAQYFNELLDWLVSYYPVFVKKILGQLAQNCISFDGLWFIFERGNRYFAKVMRNQVVGSKVLNIFYQNIPKNPPIFVVAGEVIKSNGLKYYTEVKNQFVFHYDGLRDIQSLDIQPMTQPILDLLTARGEAFRKVALGNHYQHYQRNMMLKRGRNIDYIKADGRVMVDISTFNKMNPEYTEFGSNNHQLTPQSNQGAFDRNAFNASRGGNKPQKKKHFQEGRLIGEVDRLTDDMLYRTWPTVGGFSFSAKAWGEIFVSNLSDIVFDDDAYGRLVLPEDKKQLIKAFVETQQTQVVKTTDILSTTQKDQDSESNTKDPKKSKKSKKSKGKQKQEEDDGKNKLALVPLEEGAARHIDTSANFTDIISGKGGGVIFLLHGEPGVGKTLTAEAIAELLHCPLYSVSVGELGTTTEELETRLQTILDLTSIWGAVTLLDEADIFLEERSVDDVVRNAMVGIFLRKLEYHQGVLFLTTNRITCFDAAFHSRISIAIKYDNLDREARGLVWRNLMGAAERREAGEDGEMKFDVDTSKFEEEVLNGRQIRTAVRLALALAKSEEEPFEDEHIERTIKIMKQFEEDFAKELEKDTRRVIKKKKKKKNTKGKGGHPSNKKKTKTTITTKTAFKIYHQTTTSHNRLVTEQTI